MLISKVCCELPQLVQQDLTIQQVIQKMTEEHSNGYVVVDAAHNVAGVISLQDIAVYIVPEEFRKNTSMAQAMYKPGFSMSFVNRLRMCLFPG